MRIKLNNTREPCHRADPDYVVVLTITAGDIVRYLCLSGSCVFLLLLGWDLQEAEIKFPSVDSLSPSWDHKSLLLPVSHGAANVGLCPQGAWELLWLLAWPWQEELLSPELPAKLAVQVRPCLLGGQESSSLHPSLPHFGEHWCSSSPLYYPCLLPLTGLFTLEHLSGTGLQGCSFFHFRLHSCQDPWDQPSEWVPWKIASTVLMGHPYFPRVGGCIISTLNMWS